MKLIVGLGNPGRQYEATRHNAGFWLLERLAAQTQTVLRKDARFQALVGRHAASGAWLLLPQGFMNASGRPVQMFAHFFRIAPAEILVAHDELDFAPGVVRLKQGGGTAGHNGLRDISARLGSHDYWRLRIGIGRPPAGADGADYVLGRPGEEEREAIDAAIARALEVMPLVLAGDMQGAMLKLHTEERGQKPSPAEAGRRAASDTNARAGKAASPPPGAEEAAPAHGSQPHEGRAPAAAPQAQKEEGALGSLIRRILPARDPSRRK
jgi:PTH1 family peptidyl-tRNA hydrolase